MKTTIYLDMDGVLCDWNSGAFVACGVKNYSELLDYEKKYGKYELKREIDKYGSKFWYELSWMPNGKKLWNKLYREFGSRIEILSNPHIFLYARQGKKIWVQRYLNSDIKINLESNKYLYANKNSFLIDDNEQNVESFKKNGGGVWRYEDGDNIDKIIESIYLFEYYVNKKI